jgi:hypothetical protein
VDEAALFASAERQKLLFSRHSLRPDAVLKALALLLLEYREP